MITKYKAFIYPLKYNSVGSIFQHQLKRINALFVDRNQKNDKFSWSVSREKMPFSHSHQHPSITNLVQSLLNYYVCTT